MEILQKKSFFTQVKTCEIYMISLGEMPFLLIFFTGWKGKYY